MILYYDTILYYINFDDFFIVSSMQKMVNQLGSSTDSQELRNQL